VTAYRRGLSDVEGVDRERSAGQRCRATTEHGAILSSATFGMGGKLTGSASMTVYLGPLSAVLPVRGTFAFCGDGSGGDGPAEREGPGSRGVGR
jgi:hypothetical protein